MAEPVGEPVMFASPEEAVREVERLRAEEDWEGLARCYDLEGSRVTRERLASDPTWYTLGARPAADPRGGLDAGEPFPQGSTYLRHEVEGEVARVAVEVDPVHLPPGDAGGAEGDDPPLRIFFLVRAGDGWRLLAPDDERIAG